MRFRPTSISKEIPTVIISLCSAIVVAAMGFAGAFIEGWERPDGRAIVLAGLYSLRAQT